MDNAKPITFEVREGNIVLQQGHDLIILPPEQAATLARAILVQLRRKRKA